MADLTLPDGASEEEAAAIAAAVNAHLAGGGADADDTKSRSWKGRRWRLDGRLGVLENEPVRVPRRAPSGAWRAAGRTDRF